MTALPTGFTPLVNGLRGRINQRRRRVQFGEGYVQISPDGVNDIEASFSLDFFVWGDADLNTLLDFLNGLDGDTITYTLPNESSSHEYELIDVQVQYVDLYQRNVTIEIRRVY